MKTNSIITLLVSSVILTGVSAAITHYAIRDSRNRVEWVFHTYEVIDQAAILLKRLRDVESDQRSYLITGDSSYFLNLQRSRIQLTETADTISILVTDNPQQAALLNTKLIPAITRKLYQVDAAINQ